MGYRQHERELKQPDEFQKLGASMVPWLEQHGKSVATGVGVVFAVWGLVAVYSHFQGRTDAAASAELGDALRLLARDVRAPVDVADAGASVQAPAPASESERPFGSEREKDEALVARLVDFRGKHAGRAAATTAALPLALAQLRLGKAEAAQPLLAEFLRATQGSKDLLRLQALEASGYASEAQGKHDEALAAFDTLAKEGGTGFLKGMGEYHQARILQQKGDLAGAARQFSELQTSAAGTAAARLAKDRLTLLAAQGVLPPAPAAQVALPSTGAADAGV